MAANFRLALINTQHILASVRLEEFLKELPTVIRRAEPNLTALLGESIPLARLLKLRELQTSFVYSTVLAKKNKVGVSTNSLQVASALMCLSAALACLILVPAGLVSELLRYKHQWARSHRQVQSLSCGLVVVCHSQI